MKCDRYNQEITLLACGDLPESERDEVERHVSNCASCRSEYEALRRLREKLQSLAREDDKMEVPVGLTERMEGRLARTAGRRHSISGRSVWWLATAAAACVVIGLAVWMIGRTETRRDATRQEEKSVRVVAPPPHLVVNQAEPSQVNTAGTELVYLRAWMQSPEALDDLLTREAAVRLRPEPLETALDARKFLKTMDLFEEKNNETHSMGGRGNVGVA